MPKIAIKINHIFLLIFVLLLGQWLWTMSFVRFLDLNWDPGDGDVLNVVYRLAAFKPIYGDWNKAEIFNIYPPLYSYFLLPLVTFTQHALLYARYINLFLIIASIYGLYQLGDTLFKNHSFRKELSLLSCFLFLSGWRDLGWCVNLRCDPLFLAISIFYINHLLKNPLRVNITAVFINLLVFCKQMALPTLILTSAYYWVNYRSQIKPLFFKVISIALPCLFWVEVTNHGNFLRTLYFQATTLGGGVNLTWSRCFSVFSHFCQTHLDWLILIFIPGLILCLRRPEPPHFWLGLAWIIEFLFQIYITRHEGAGPPYLWFLWALTSLLGATCIGHLCLWLERRASFRPQFLASLILIWPWFWSPGIDYVILLQDSPRQTGFISQVEKTHRDQIHRLVRLTPDAKWMSQRNSVALVQEGVILDHEACTINFVVRNREKENWRYLTQQLLTGDFEWFIKNPVASCGRFPGLTYILNNCFSLYERSQSVNNGALLALEILRYTGKNKKGCAL